MRYKLAIAFLIITFMNCSTEPDAGNSKEIIDIEFTLELAFGADDSLGDFLLARPRGFVVADNGDIIVSDENRLKVFDSNGKPKRIIGRPGPGPGEFGRITLLTLSETGYIAAIQPMNNPFYNLFDSEYSFIERKNLRNSELRKKLLKMHNDWYNPYFNMLYFYSPEEIVIYTQVDGMRKGDLQNSYFALIHQKGEELTTIANCKSEDFSEASSIANGSLVFTLLPGRKVAYMHSGEDRFIENGLYYYSISFYDLKTHEQTKIIKDYIPVAIPDSVIFPKKNPFEGLENAEKLYKERSEKLKKAKVYPPIQGIHSDGNYLFVFTFEYFDDKGYVVDVFDGISKQYLSKVCFPISAMIKNGYAYRSTENKEGFSIIEKYKIDPAVYVK